MVSNDGVDVIWTDDMTIIQLNDKLKRCNLKTDIKTEPVKSNKQFKQQYSYRTKKMGSEMIITGTIDVANHITNRKISEKIDSRKISYHRNCFILFKNVDSIDKFSDDSEKIKYY